MSDLIQSRLSARRERKQILRLIARVRRDPTLDGRQRAILTAVYAFIRLRGEESLQ